MLDLALETFGGLVLAAEDAYDTAHADKDLPQVFVLVSTKAHNFNIIMLDYVGDGVNIRV
jgi:hypothetical protein